MKTSRVMALSISAVVLGLFATGCSKGSSSTDSSKASDVTTITVWTGDSHNKKFMDNKIAEWNKSTGKEKKIKIDYQVKDKIGDMLDVAFTSDQAPDLFPIPDLEKYVSDGRVEAIEDLPGGQELVDKYDGKLSYNKHIFDGKTYTLPSGATTYGLVYNKEMFEKAGIVDEDGEALPPATFEDLVADAKKLTDESKQQYGIALPGKYSDWFGDDVLKPAFSVTGYMHFNPETGQYDFTTGVQKVMETLLQIKDDKSFLPGVEGLDNDPARARFAEGNIGMYFSASYDYGVFTDQFPAKMDWGVAPYPVEDEATAHKQFLSYNRYLAVNKNSVKSKSADKLMEVYKFFYSDDMISDSYKEGYSLPYDFSLVKGVKVKGDQWEQYAKLLDISYQPPGEMPVELSGEKTMNQVWIEDIWSGKVNSNKLGSALKDLTDEYNDGIKKYEELHPDFDPSPFIVKDWESQTKR